jgi:hypothetical protein
MRPPSVTQMKRTSFCGQFFDFAATRNRKVHAPRLAVDMTEFEAGFCDRWIIDDGEEARRIGHDRAVEECLVVVEQIDQVDVAFKVSILLTELLHHPAQL